MYVLIFISSNYIYENWNYELSDKMIKIILMEKVDIDISCLNEAHMTTIIDSGVKELIEYIDTNIKKFLHPQKAKKQKSPFSS